MSSKRRIRRKSCEGKARHATSANAEIAIRVMARQQDASIHRLRPYRCSFCGHFHIGHQYNGVITNRRLHGSPSRD